MLKLCYSARVDPIASETEESLQGFQSPLGDGVGDLWSLIFEEGHLLLQNHFISQIQQCWEEVARGETCFVGHLETGPASHLPRDFGRWTVEGWTAENLH